MQSKDQERLRSILAKIRDNESDLEDLAFDLSEARTGTDEEQTIRDAVSSIEGARDDLHELAGGVDY